MISVDQGVVAMASGDSGLLRGLAPPSRSTAGSARYSGSALFADVTGFTRLTDRLVATHGRRRGAELLHRVLEESLERTIRSAARFGGVPVAFAGDALTLWFDGDGSAARAATCALDLASPSTEMLGLRVSVASGMLDLLDVGSAEEGRMQLVGGATVAQLALLDAQTHDGAVLVCENTLAALGPAASVARAPGRGAWRLTALDAPARGSPPANPAYEHDVDAIEWVPAPLRPLILGAEARARAGTPPDFSELAELRPVIPLFLHFGDLPVSEAEAIRTLVDRVQKELQSRGGTVLNTNSDAKGSYITGVFGAPTAHEDDAERALDAAAALAGAGADLGAEIRIGLNRGSALVGAIGIGTRPRYDVIGATMNRAARMMMHAEPGQALLTAELDECHARRFATHPVRGTGLPEGARRLGAPSTADTATTSAAPDLLERDDELARVQAALGDPDVGVVVLEGPPGFGKSTLLEAVRREAAAKGTLWLRGGGDELARDRAFHSMRPVFDALLHEAADDDTRAVLSWAAGHSEEPPGQLAALGGSERAATIATALSKLLADTARQRPAVIALDNGQWVDSVTLGMLLRVRLGGTPVKLILARRPGAATTPEGAALLEAPDTIRVALGPLSDAAVLRLAEAELQARSLAYDLGRLIVENAGGSPLFAQEIARVLSARDLLRSDGGHVSAATGSERLARLDFVESLEAAILARFDALPLARKQVARAASAVGQTFSVDALRVALGDPHEQPGLEDELRALRADGYLDQAGDGAADSFAFRHALVRDAINESMTFAARARINARLAEWWAEQGVGPEAMHRRARHLLEAVRVDEAEADRLHEAIAALQAAAHQAASDYANLESSWLLEDALDLVRRLPETEETDRLRLQVQSTLAFCLATFRGYGDPTVEDAYRKAMELTVDARPSEELAFTLYGLFSFFSSRGDYSDAIRLARRLHRLARRFDDPRLASVAHQARGIVAILRGRPAIGARLAAASIADAERMGDRAVFSQGGTGPFVVFSAAWLALSEAVRGRADAARAAHAWALEQAAPHPFATGFIKCFCPLPVLEGDPARSLELANEIVADADARGFALFSVVGRIYQAWAQARLTPGDAAALATLGQHLQIAQAMGLASFTPLFLALGADAHGAGGDVAAASAAIDAGNAVVARTGGRLFAPELSRTAAGLPNADSASLLAHAIAESRARGTLLFTRKSEQAARLGDEAAAVPRAV